MSDEQTETLAPQGQRARTATDEFGLIPLRVEGVERLAPAFVLRGQTTFIGRQPPDGNLLIPVSTMSRVHASLTKVGAQLKVNDLRSHNGTFVNGERVTEQTLTHGDVLRMGDALFKVVTSRAGEFAAAPVAERFAGQLGGLALLDVQRELEAIAPARVPVLIHGETGAGKEGVARGLHDASKRDGPFRAINCAAIPAQLVESELFGHRKGSFTGATRDHPGLFRATDRGTLLLDEIGDMPLEAQAKLLRVLETREVVAVGAHQADAVDVRTLAATHHDLRALVDAGKFRADLYARLNGYHLRVPPLRERIEDVPALVKHLLARDGAKNEVSFGFIYALVLHDWPFNVRELASVLTRAVTLARGAALDVQHLPQEVQQSASRAKERAEPEVGGKQKRPDAAELEALIIKARGNIAAVARTLNRDRALVHRWLKDAGIDPERFRE